MKNGKYKTGHGLITVVAGQKGKSAHFGTGIMKFGGNAWTSAHSPHFPIPDLEHIHEPRQYQY